MNDRMLDFQPEPAILSPAGRRRKEEILDSLQRTRQRRKVRRMALHTTLSLAVIAAASVVGLRTSPRVGLPIPDESPIVAQSHSPIIQIVRGDASSIRIITSDGPSLVRVLSDDELLASLRQAGRPDGIARVGGKFMLASEIAILNGG